MGVAQHDPTGEGEFDHMTPMPAYLYPGQWADQLGSLASLTFNSPRVAHDLASIPMSPNAQNAISSSVLGSQLPPYSQ